MHSIFKILSITACYLLVLGSARAAVLTLSAPSGNLNDNIKFEVSVSDFTDIAGLSTSFSWMPSKLSFQGASDISLPGLSAINFSYIQPGALTLVWVDLPLAGVSVANGSVIFALNFTVATAATDSATVSFTSSPTAQEIVDYNGNSIPFTFNNGTASLNAIPEPQGWLLVSFSSALFLVRRSRQN